MEEDFPYRGVGADGKSHTLKPAYPYEDFIADPEQGTLEVIAELNNTDVAGARAILEDAAEKDGVTYEEELAYAYQFALSCYQSTEYSKADDWTIPTTDANGAPNRFKHAGLIIKDGNVLPAYREKDSTDINEASITAIKQELANGRGVCINYRADQAQPGAASDSTYINRDNWAQYTFEDVAMTHAVCLVGWDDNYPASNFTHDVYIRDDEGKPIPGDDGKPQIDPESKTKTTPPGNGAWIVKNSWGSETDMMEDDLGNTTGGGTYGVRNDQGKATGYFYLSYYDRTISNPETMSFSDTLMSTTGVIDIFQHDYMAATGSFYGIDPSSNVMSSANVFDLTKDDGDQVILSVGGRTSDENQRMTFAIYRLNDDAADPTDGKLLYRTSSSFEYAGYHRLDLEQPVAVRAGHKYSVVSTVSEVDEKGNRTYAVSASQGISKQIRDWQNKQPRYKDYNLVWTKAVVNEGESYLYKDGKWVDWSKYISAIPASDVDDADVQKAGPFERYIDALPIDNFSIKMYAAPARIPLTHQKAVAPTCTKPGNIEYWWYEVIESTDTLEGMKLYFADAEGTKPIELKDTVIPIDPNAHRWGAWKKLDDHQHQRICKNDPTHVEKANHVWDEGIITSPATEKAEGTKTFTCTECKATKTESIPKHKPQLKPQEEEYTQTYNNVKTGDESAVGIWIALMFAAMAGLAGTVFVTRKRRKGRL